MRRFLPCLAVFSFLIAVPLPAQAPSTTTTPAERAWRLGQQALDGDRFQEAIGQFQISLRLDPKMAQAHLSLAAAYLALGEDRLALPHLSSYLEARPDHFLIRLHFADLLSRLDQLDDARLNLERVVSEVQEFPRLAEDHLVGCHTRLMEIARDLGDDYEEHLHRGIGLYLLARKRADLGDEGSHQGAEELLCKAAAELTLARLRDPRQARPCWYLHGVWTQLAQRQPAVKWLRAAEQSAGWSDLTPTEQRDLHLTSSVRHLERERK
jgi:tetratricopeptide (TPR) repeat protein